MKSAATNRFAADWLAQREPHDRRARNRTVLGAVVAALPPGRTLGIVDLGCGTGATLRALAPVLAAPQHWRLVDRDTGLIGRLGAPQVPCPITMTALPLDLSVDLTAALDGPLDLVVASALLDLVSETWLEQLARALAGRGLPFYAALSYDGRVALAPADPLDAAMIAAFNSHQHSDKGFGRALGPEAACRAIARLRALGYDVLHGRSDWVLAPHDGDLQLALLDGWAGAASAAGAVPAQAASWLGRRRDLVLAGRSAMRVGHVDFWARQIAIR